LQRLRLDILCAEIGRRKIVDNDLAEILTGFRLKVQKRGIRRENPLNGGADVVVPRNSPEVYCGPVVMFAKGKQEPVTLGQPRFKDNLVGDSLKLLHPYAGIPQSVLEKLELFSEPLLLLLTPGQQVALHC